VSSAQAYEKVSFCCHYEDPEDILDGIAMTSS